jgi:hypothetical protein
VGAAHLIDAELADARFHQPVEGALYRIGASQWPFPVADITGHEIVEYNRDSLSLRGWCSVIKGVLAAVNALT